LQLATLHLGYSSRSFSPYSLNGHTFAGVGTDLTPNDHWQLSAMYGRLQKASRGDSLHGVDPAYTRYGTGLKGEYRFDKGEAGINLFYARDNLSQPIDNVDSLGITPQENLIVGTHVGLDIIQSLKLTADVNNSMQSSDRRLSSATDLKGAATRNYWAMKSNLTYNIPIGSLGLGVEYVEPGYNSLGSYYMVNDFIDYTVNVATALLKGKVTLAVSSGIRQNNLSGDSDNTQKDVVNNVAIGFTPTDKLNFNFTYSNFLNYTYIRTTFEEVNTHTQYELMDTLNFTQINENLTLSMMWRLHETETVKHSVNATACYQQATQTQSDVPGNAGSTFWNGSGGYQVGMPKAGFTTGLNFNYSRVTADSVVTQAYGPIVMVRKSLLKKQMQTNLSLSWNGTYTAGISTGEVITGRAGLSYAIKKVHQLNFSIAYTDRHSPTRSSSGFTAMLGYSFRFDYPKEEVKSP